MPAPEQPTPQSHIPDLESFLQELYGAEQSPEQLQATALGLHQNDFMAQITPITSPTTPDAPSSVFALGFATEIGVAWQFTKLVGNRLFTVEVRRATEASMSDAVSLGEFFGFFMVDTNNHRGWGTSVTRYYQVRTIGRSGETMYFSGWTPATPVSATTLAPGSSNADLQTRMDTFGAQVQALHLYPHVLSSLSQAVSVLSQQLSVISQQVSILSQKVSVLSSLPAASVTSNEVSAVSAQAASALSNALSGVSVVNATLSARIDTVSNAVSVVSQALSVLSQATSVANAALSIRVDTQSQSISVLSQGHSVLSQAVSVLSQSVSVQAAALSIRVDTVSNQVSTLSLRVYSSQLTALVSVSGLISTDNRISNAVSLVSTAAANALSVANAASNAASVVSVAVNVVSNALSNELSVRAAAINVVSNVASNALSVANVQSNLFSTLRGGAAGLFLKKSALADFNWVWAAAGGATSVDVTSNKISILSQGISVISQALSVEIVNRTNNDNSLSNLISAKSGGFTLLYTFNSAVTTPPLSGETRLNNTNPSLATNLYIHITDRNTSSMRNVLLELPVGTLIKLFVEANNTVNAFYKITAVTDNSTWFDFTVTFLTGAGTFATGYLMGFAFDTGALSQAISVLSQQVSVLSQGLSVVSNATSNALSVANAASNAASVVSQALSAEIVNRISADNVLSNAISVVSAAGGAAYGKALIWLGV